MSIIRTALIGFGTAGRVFHAPLLAHDPQFSLEAIVARSPHSVDSARAAYPKAAILPDASDVFDSADKYDLVVIATPNATHATFAHRAIAAGLNVVIDKPIAVTTVEATALSSAARAAGVKFSVFQNRRWDGDFLTVRDTIDRGLLGDVHQFESAFEWWKPSLGKAWKDSSGHAEGGGILYDLGPHLIDQALQLFGDVREVHAELDLRRPGAQGDDDSFVSLTHASGVRSRLWMNAVAPANRPRFRVVGSSAVLTTWGLDPQESQAIAGRLPGDDQFGLHDDDRVAELAGPSGITSISLNRGRYTEFYRQMAGALIEGTPLPVDPADSIRALDLIERALAGAR